MKQFRIGTAGHDVKIFLAKKDGFFFLANENGQKVRFPRFRLFGSYEKDAYVCIDEFFVELVNGKFLKLFALRVKSFFKYFGEGK